MSFKRENNFFYIIQNPSLRKKVIDKLPNINTCASFALELC